MNYTNKRRSPELSEVFKTGSYFQIQRPSNTPRSYSVDADCKTNKLFTAVGWQLWECSLRRWVVAAYCSFARHFLLITTKILRKLCYFFANTFISMCAFKRIHYISVQKFYFVRNFTLYSTLHTWFEIIAAYAEIVAHVLLQKASQIIKQKKILHSLTLLVQNVIVVVCTV